MPWKKQRLYSRTSVAIGFTVGQRSNTKTTRIKVASYCPEPLPRTEVRYGWWKPIPSFRSQNIATKHGMASRYIATRIRTHWASKLTRTFFWNKRDEYWLLFCLRGKSVHTRCNTQTHQNLRCPFRI
jgi:hypothetical protein